MERAIDSLQVLNKMPQMKSLLTDSHQDIVSDMHVNGPKSKYNFLLMYDNQILKDREFVELQATDNLEYRDELAINNS